MRLAGRFIAVHRDAVNFILTKSVSDNVNRTRRCAKNPQTHQWHAASPPPRKRSKSAGSTFPPAAGRVGGALPKEFELRQRTLALQEEYWVAHSLQDEALEFRLQAVAFVSHGAFLHKFRKSGRESRRRAVKDGGEGLCILHWEKKSAVVRADAEVYRAASRASTCSTRARASR